MSFPTVNQDEKDHRKVNAVVRNVVDGKTNNTASLTLTASVGTTVVTDFRAGAESYVCFMPLTANAAAELAAGTMYVSSQGTNTFTITHQNAITTDRTFRYIVVA